MSQQLANSSTPAVPELSSLSPVVSSTRLNGFWFYGLVVSVITGSFGILIKQWLRESLIDETSAEVYLRVRFCRFEGLETWRVFETVATLPLMLQVSVLLFFLGLKELLGPLDEHVNSAVTILVYVWAGLLVVSSLAPVISARCPWKTPLLNRPLRFIRGRLFTGYANFQEWRFNDYEMDWEWHPRSWFNEAISWLGHCVISVARSFKSAAVASITAIKGFFVPDAFQYLSPRQLEEEVLAGTQQHDFEYLLGTYELVPTDEHLSLVIVALGDAEFSLNEVLQCLEGVYKLRESYLWTDEDDDEELAPETTNRLIGLPSSYGRSLVPKLIPLLVDKIQCYVSRSGTVTEDLSTALQFILDRYNEQYIDMQILWPLIGGMLLDYNFTRVTMEALVDRWEVMRDVPKFPQLHQSQSKSTSCHRTP